MDGVEYSVFCDEQGLPPADVALFDAVRNNDLAALKSRIDAGIDLNQPRGDGRGEGIGRSPLTLAIELNHYDCMRMLLDAGANVHFSTEDYLSPLRVALHQQDAASVQILLDHGADPFYFAGTKRADGTEYGKAVTDLEVAAEGDQALAQMVEDAAPKFELCHLLETTKPTEPNDIAAITALLDRGCPVNIKDNEGRNALIYACVDADAPLIRLLLDRGADPNLTMNDGETTAFHYAVACHNSNAGIVRMLLDAGADLHNMSKSGRTMMHSAARSGNQEILQLLAERGLSPEARDAKGHTPASAFVADQMGTDDDIHPVMDRVVAWRENLIETISRDATQLAAPVQPMKKLRFAPKTRG